MNYCCEVSYLDMFACLIYWCDIVPLVSFWLALWTNAAAVRHTVHLQFQLVMLTRAQLHVQLRLH